MNSASGLTKRLTNQGHAMRSILGCSRVTHLFSDGATLGRVGSLHSFQAAMPPSRTRQPEPRSFAERSPRLG